MKPDKPNAAVGHTRAPSYTDDDYRRLHAQLVDTQRQLEEERRSADGEFVKAAIRVMQANPGFSARDYADSGISADDFETFFAEDMNEAWRCYEREKARAEAAEDKLAALTTEAAGRVTDAEIRTALADWWAKLLKLAVIPGIPASVAADELVGIVSTLTNAALPHMPAVRWQPIETATIFGKVYAHCCIKYDPDAGKRVISNALNESFRAGIEAAAAYHDKKALKWKKEAERHERGYYSDHEQNDLRRSAAHQKWADELRALPAPSEKGGR